MTTSFYILLRREILLALRSGGDTCGCVLFFLLCGCLFPLALGPSPTWLYHVGPGIMWVCALLASLLPLDKMFAADYEDGSLDLLMIQPVSAPAIALLKITTHWLSSGVPVVLASILLGLMFHLRPIELLTTCTSLALGSLTFSLIGGMIAATMLGARRNGMLLPLLVLPLATPPLIFGAATSYATQLGTSTSTNFCLLGACFLTALPLCPLAAGVGLREACR